MLLTKLESFNFKDEANVETSEVDVISNVKIIVPFAFRINDKTETSLTLNPSAEENRPE